MVSKSREKFGILSAPDQTFSDVLIIKDFSSNGTVTGSIVGTNNNSLIKIEKVVRMKRVRHEFTEEELEEFPPMERERLRRLGWFQWEELGSSDGVVSHRQALNQCCH